MNTDHCAMPQNPVSLQERVLFGKPLSFWEKGVFRLRVS